MKRTALISVAALALLLFIALYAVYFSAPSAGASAEQFVVPQKTTQAQITAKLKSDGFIRNITAFDFVLNIRGSAGNIAPGSYEISKSMSAWEIAGALGRGPESLWITIPEGLRKEEIAAIFAKTLGWTPEQENEFITKDTSSSPDYFEGVYFPDTYLVPKNETPKEAATRLRSHFEEVFAPYAKEALAENIKWTTLLTLASIVQREAAGKADMHLVAGILWNRLLKHMKLQADSTVQYARGDTPNGWWAPVTTADLKINSPYNTYIHYGLPPHPISNPGLDAIEATLYPATTTCLYYIHDSSRNIHCSATYQGQLDNIQKYLK